MPLVRLGLQAAQDDFLQPLGDVGPVLAQRGGCHPEALAQPALGRGCAKGQFARCQLVQHDADGKDVAARVAAHAHHLLRGNPGRRSHRLAQFLCQQVRVVRMAGESEVQQDGMVVAAEQHIAGLEIEVAHVLLVQAVHGPGHGGAQAGDGVGRWAFGLLQPVVQRGAVDILHHQVGQAVHVTRGHEARYMRPGEGGQDLQFHLKTDDVLRAIASRHARDLHGQREPWIGWSHGIFDTVDVRHSTRVDAIEHRESIDLGSRFQ